MPSPSDIPYFYTLCDRYSLDAATLNAIAEKAEIDKRIMEAMYVGMPVSREDAESLLVAFSAHVGKTYTLENTKVVFLPTFESLLFAHHIDIDYIKQHAGVPPHIIDQLLVNEPISPDAAKLILDLISRLSGCPYTLDQVDFPLLEEEAVPAHPLTVAGILHAHPDLRASDIDSVAAVQAGTTQRMVEMLPVSQEEARRVLAVISERTRQCYVFGAIDPSLLTRLQAVHPILPVDVKIEGEGD